MKPILRTLTAGGLVALLLGAACVDAPQSVVILQNQIPNSECVVEGSETAPFRSSGSLDVAFTTQCIGNDVFDVSYTMFPLLKNLMPSTEDLENDETEKNYIVLVEARVVLDLGPVGGNLDTAFTRFRYPVFKTLAPGEQAPIAVLAIPPQTVQAIAAQIPQGDAVIARAKVHFVYKHAGIKKKTHSIEFPIHLCNGCNIVNLGACTNLVAPPEAANTSLGCLPFQDKQIFCCELGGGCLSCPPPDNTTTP